MMIKNYSIKAGWVNIIIIDACRKSFGRGTSNSFTQIHAPEGTIIAFSTSLGESAKDSGMEGHSLYTGTLLKYIGRESLSVEDLFKKTRKTVFNLSNGTQTSWEHTSLVGDFYFNTGQLIYSVSIPYDEAVVKDRLIVSTGSEVDQIITDLSSCNWDKQNPAITRFKHLSPDSLNKDQQFIIGRNILQSSGYAFNATNFMDNLSENLIKYNADGTNHILNGILYEIYFDNNGDFRKRKIKNQSLDNVFRLRHNSAFVKSFDFIGKALEPYSNEIYYIPKVKDTLIDVDITARQAQQTDLLGNEENYQVVDSIHVMGKDITASVKEISYSGRGYDYLVMVLVGFLFAPTELININSNIPITKFEIESNEEFVF